MPEPTKLEILERKWREAIVEVAEAKRAYDKAGKKVKDAIERLDKAKDAYLRAKAESGGANRNSSPV